MSIWLEAIKTFLIDNWLVITIAMVVVYYIYNYLLVLMSVLVFPSVALGATMWGLNRFMTWPKDEASQISGRNISFFIAGSLAFVIEIYLFSIFLDAFLLGKTVVPVFGKWGVDMSVLSGLAFGLVALIFGHLAHHTLAKSKTAWENLVGWTAAVFFLVAALVLSWSGGVRAQTIAEAGDVSNTVKIFSIIIGAAFGFMMPFGAVVGMSRGGFVWVIIRGLLLGIPLSIGLLLLIIASFTYFLFEVVITVFTILVRQVSNIVGGFFGLRPNKENVAELTGWKIGMNHLLSSAEVPERMQHFLENSRRYMNFWEEEQMDVKRRKIKLPPPPEPPGRPTS